MATPVTLPIPQQRSPSPHVHAVLTSPDFKPVPVVSYTPTQFSTAQQAFLHWTLNGTPGSACNHEVPSIIGELVVNFSICAATRRSIFGQLGAQQTLAKLLISEDVLDLLTNRATQAHWYRLTHASPPTRVVDPTAILRWYSNPKDMPPPFEISNFAYSEVFLQLSLQGEGPAPFIAYYTSHLCRPLFTAAIADAQSNAQSLAAATPAALEFYLTKKRLSRRDGSQIDPRLRLILCNKLYDMGDAVPWASLSPLKQILSSQTNTNRDSISSWTSFVWKHELTGSLGLRLACACTLLQLHSDLGKASTGVRPVFDTITTLATSDDVINYLVDEGGLTRAMGHGLQPFQKAAAFRAAVALYYELDVSACHEAMTMVMSTIVSMILQHLPELRHAVNRLSKGAVYDPPTPPIVSMPAAKRSKSHQ